MYKKQELYEIKLYVGVHDPYSCGYVHKKKVKSKGGGGGEKGALNFRPFRTFSVRLVPFSFEYFIL